MDSQGFVLLTRIADFNRVKRIAEGQVDLLRTVAQVSEDVVEYQYGSDGKDRIRHPTQWQKYVLADKSQRDPSVQHDGVEAAPRESWPVRPATQQITPINPTSPMSAFPYAGHQAFGEFPRAPNTDLVDYGRFQSPPMNGQPFMTPHMNGQPLRSPYYNDPQMNGFFSSNGSPVKPMNYSPPKSTAQPTGLNISTDEQNINTEQPSN
jgi:hypothetical protein